MLYAAGHLSAELRNANGTVPVDVVRRDRDRYAISFVPLIEGMLLFTKYGITVMVAGGTNYKGQTICGPPTHISLRVANTLNNLSGWVTDHLPLPL